MCLDMTLECSSHPCFTYFFGFSLFWTSVQHSARAIIPFHFADLRNLGRRSRVVCICRMEVLIMSACDFHKYAGDRELSQSAPPEEFRSVR